MKRTKIHNFCLILSIAAIGWVRADIVPQGRGIVYGIGYVFSLKAPNGWMLDSESGVGDGFHAVFYPEGSNWKNGSVVCYPQAHEKTDALMTADQVAKDRIRDYRENGSPNYTGELVKVVKSDHGETARIFHFKNDQWGNLEAVAYFEERKTINYVTMSSRDAKAFANALSAFDELVKSYVFIGESLQNLPRAGSQR